MSDNDGKIELWFFRDLVDAQRLKLFAIFGIPTSELVTLGAQKIAINSILKEKTAVLDKPARVGNAVFRKGVAVEAVILAAQRAYEHAEPTLSDFATRLFDLHGFMLQETYRDKPAVTVTFPDLKEAQQFHNTLVELSTHRPRPQSIADYVMQQASIVTTEESKP